MIKFKSIKLHPSDFKLDVWVGDTLEVASYYLDYYGFSINRTEGNIGNNECALIYSSDKSKAGGEKRIAIKLVSLDDVGIVVHEMIHSLFEFSNVVNTELKYDTTEWNALMGEYIFNEIMKNNYEEIGDIENISDDNTNDTDE